jgi:hypothetical protein
MTIQNVTFGFPIYSPTLSGGSWDSDFPISRALIPVMTDVARSSDATLASTQFVMTLNPARSVQTVGIALTNASVEAQVRITLRDGDDATLQTTGWFDVWRKIYEPFELGWGEPSFMTLRLEVENLEALVVPYTIFSSASLASSVLVEIDDTSNTDGYVEVGYCQCASARELSVNMAPGAQEGFLARSEVQVSSGGVRSVERRDKPRTLAFTTTIPTDERRGVINTMQRLLDLDEPFLVIQEPTGDRFANQTSLFMRFAELRTADRLLGSYDTQAFRLEQAL